MISFHSYPQYIESTTRSHRIDNGFLIRYLTDFRINQVVGCASTLHPFILHPIPGKSSHSPSRSRDIPVSLPTCSISTLLLKHLLYQNHPLSASTDFESQSVNSLMDFPDFPSQSSHPTPSIHSCTFRTSQLNLCISNQQFIHSFQ